MRRRRPTRHYSHWYLLSIRGIFLIILGVFALQTENTTSPFSFAKLFEIFTLLSGSLLIPHALLNRKHKNWQFVLFNGIFDLFYGVILWITPELNLLDLKLALSIWFLYSGLIQSIDSLVLIHDNVKNWWFELISGMMSISLAFILIAVHLKIQKEVYWMVGVFALVFGMFLIVSSFMLRENEEEDLYSDSKLRA